jgi:Protein of unknown function (DUF3592)
VKKGVYLLWMVIGFGVMIFIFGRNFSMFNTQNAEANAVTYVKTTGTVKEIVRAGVSRRQKQTQVLVNFKTTDGKSFDGVISLMRWPLVGSMTDKGDEVSVYYNPQKPQMARSIYDEYNFIFANIFFVLAGLCIAICVITAFVKMLRAKPGTGQKTE